MPPRMLKQIPRFGWTLVDLESRDLDPIINPTTNVRERPAGLLRASLSVFVADGAATGAGRFTVVLEGSQFGDPLNPAEWAIIAELNSSELLIAPSPLAQVQQRLLGATILPLGRGFRGEGQVSISRFKYIRVRTFVVEEDPLDPVDYVVNVRLTGIEGDGEAMERATSLVKASGVVGQILGDPFFRPEGTRYMTAQVLASAMILDPPGSDGYAVILQGAVSRNAVDDDEWYTIDSTGAGNLVAAGDSVVFHQGQVSLIDMGPFNYFRFLSTLAIAAPPNPSGPLSSYTLDCLATFDDNDWIDGDVGLSLLNETLQETFCGVVFGDPEPQAGNTIDIPIQIVDINSRPLNGARRIGIVISDSPNFGGQLAPSAVARVSAIADGDGLGSAFVFPPVVGGTSQVIIELDTAGTAILTIDSGGVAGTYRVEAFNVLPGDTSESNQVLVNTQRVSLTFV